MTTLNEGKFNKVDVLLADNIAKFGKYIREAIRNESVQLLQNQDQTSWAALARATLVRVVIFNKRRAEESSKTVDAYKSRPDWKKTQCAEIFKSLILTSEQSFDCYNILQL